MEDFANDILTIPSGGGSDEIPVTFYNGEKSCTFTSTGNKLQTYQTLYVINVIPLPAGSLVNLKNAGGSIEWEYDLNYSLTPKSGLVSNSSILIGIGYYYYTSGSYYTPMYTERFSRSLTYGQLNTFDDHVSGSVPFSNITNPDVSVNPNLCFVVTHSTTKTYITGTVNVTNLNIRFRFNQ